MFGTSFNKKSKMKRACSNVEFCSKLRELADCLEGKITSMKLDGEQIGVPSNARMSIEHEMKKGEEELELKIKWAIH